MENILPINYVYLFLCLRENIIYGDQGLDIARRWNACLEMMRSWGLAPVLRKLGASRGMDNNLSF